MKEPGDGGQEALGSSQEAAGGGSGLHYQVFFFIIMLCIFSELINLVQMFKYRL